MMNQKGNEINFKQNDDHLDYSELVTVYLLYIIQKQSRSLIMIELDSRTFHYANRCKTEHKY